MSSLPLQGQGAKLPVIHLPFAAQTFMEVLVVKASLFQHLEWSVKVWKVFSTPSLGRWRTDCRTSDAIADLDHRSLPIQFEI